MLFINKLAYFLAPLSIGSALGICFFEHRNLTRLFLQNANESQKELYAKRKKRNVQSLLYFLPGMITCSIYLSPVFAGIGGVLYSAFRYRASSMVSVDKNRKFSKFASNSISTVLLLTGLGSLAVVVVRDHGFSLATKVAQKYVNRQLKNFKLLLKVIKRLFGIDSTPKISSH